MTDVDLEPVPDAQRQSHRLRPLGTDLPGGPALGAVKVAMVRRRKDMELLATIGAVTVPHQAELLEDVERAIDRRRDAGRVAGAAALHEIGAGDVAVGLGEHLDHRSSLRRPAQAAFAQAIADGVPGWLQTGHDHRRIVYYCNPLQ